MAIQLTRKIKAFVDISLAFEPNPVTGDLSVLTNERAINQSIKNLVQTIPGEAAFDHNVGSNARAYMFDQMKVLRAFERLAAIGSTSPE